MTNETQVLEREAITNDINEGIKGDVTKFVDTTVTTKPIFIGVGKVVADDLAPLQIMKEAGLDWKVEKRKLFAERVIDGKKKRLSTDNYGLFRETDNEFLSSVSADWEPLQNQEAFEFYNEFIEAGDMKMISAGSLDNGRLVWAVAEVNEYFDITKGDTVKSYLLLTNPHRFGKAIDVRSIPMRIACSNMICMALKNGAIDGQQVRVTHHKKFDPQLVKDILAANGLKLNEFRERLQFLNTKQYDKENIVEFFKRVFPAVGTQKEMHKSAALGLELLGTTPGHEYSEGTWNDAFQTITYMNNHVLSRTEDTRFQRLMYGYAAKINNKALDLAIEYAEA